MACLMSSPPLLPKRRMVLTAMFLILLAVARGCILEDQFPALRGYRDNVGRVERESARSWKGQLVNQIECYHGREPALHRAAPGGPDPHHHFWESPVFQVTRLDIWLWMEWRPFSSSLTNNRKDPFSRFCLDDCISVWLLWILSVINVWRCKRMRCERNCRAWCQLSFVTCADFNSKNAVTLRGSYAFP